jgi:hypothetical protein
MSCCRPVNSSRTQNGHIRNDMRDVSRRMCAVRTSSICRRNCVAIDRGCTRMTPRNLHGKEGSPVRVRQRALKSPQNGDFCCLDWYNGHLHCKEGIGVGGGSTTQRDAGNHQQFLGAPAALRSWGQVLAAGTVALCSGSSCTFGSRYVKSMNFIPASFSRRSQQVRLYEASRLIGESGANRSGCASVAQCTPSCKRAIR